MKKSLAEFRYTPPSAENCDFGRCLCERGKYRLQMWEKKSQYKTMRSYELRNLETNEVLHIMSSNPQYYNPTHSDINPKDGCVLLSDPKIPPTIMWIPPTKTDGKGRIIKLPATEETFTRLLRRLTIVRTTEHNLIILVSLKEDARRCLEIYEYQLDSHYIKPKLIGFKQFAARHSSDLLTPLRTITANTLLFVDLANDTTPYELRGKTSLFFREMVLGQSRPINATRSQLPFNGRLDLPVKNGDICIVETCHVPQYEHLLTVVVDNFNGRFSVYLCDTITCKTDLLEEFEEHRLLRNGRLFFGTEIKIEWLNLDRKIINRTIPVPVFALNTHTRIDYMLSQEDTGTTTSSTTNPGMFFATKIYLPGNREILAPRCMLDISTNFDL